jgi:methionyl-tRNA synthetase
LKAFLPVPVDSGEASDAELKRLPWKPLHAVEDFMNQLKTSDALAELWKLVRRSNKYIDENMPWELAKDPADEARLGTVIYNLLESIRFIAVMLQPFMPRRRSLSGSRWVKGRSECACRVGKFETLGSDQPGLERWSGAKIYSPA